MIDVTIPPKTIAVPVAFLVAPPPVNVTVGVDVYPEPLFVTIAPTVPCANVIGAAIAAAFDPPPPENEMPGTIVIVWLATFCAGVMLYVPTPPDALRRLTMVVFDAKFGPTTAIPGTILPVETAETVKMLVVALLVIEAVTEVGI